ncbi:MAG: sigma-54-dependent transcriptional regulator [Acidiferrobacterales bacterium]
MADTLLVIEDETLLGTELARHYRREGWEVVVATDIASAERALLDQLVEPLVVLSDMSLPDGNALDLLEKVRGQRACGEWIFLTAYGSVPDSVRALRLGAFDFLEKPCDQERLDVVVAGAARSGRAQRRLRDEAAAQSRKYPPLSFIGHSQAAGGVRDMLAKLSRVPFSALILSGETGSGKGLAARILHHSGARCEGPLIELNCAALPRELLESELFGHEAGAFTGARGRHRGLLEQAHGGTLFLDEIGEMNLDLQAKLLKAIEDRTIRRLGGDREIRVEVQIIAASNRNLESQVHAGTFRHDLYHRLNVFHLNLPALRERREDVDDLVPAFIAEFNSKAGKSVKVISQTVRDKLHSHDWPGNVRELRNVVERCVLFADGEVFPERWLQLRSATFSVPVAPWVDGNRLCLPFDGSMALEDMDRHIIQLALERNNFNVTAAARALGATRETLRYRIQKYNLAKPNN